MQTVNFQCGNCGQLMAVGTEFLGQQVRCPHCGQVVVAPATQPPEAGQAPAPPPPESAHFRIDFAAPTVPESESIFSPPAESEDLFGAGPAPHLELLPKPAMPQLSPTAPSPEAASQPMEAASAFLPSPTNGGGIVPPAADATAPPPASESGPGGMEAPPNGGLAVAASDLSVIPRPPRRGQGGGWFTALVFVPLVFYAIMATVAVAILYQRQQAENKHPLEEFLPDEEGDNPGARHLKALSNDSRRLLVKHSLAPALRTRLNQPLVIGDLEVTPLGVEWRRVSVRTKGFEKTVPCQGDSLVLRLRLRNLSPDVAFHPLDNFFTRRWREDKPDGPPPLTFLEAGSRRFFGGPAAWSPLPARRENRVEWVEDTHYERELPPGETLLTFVCTDGDDDRVAKTLKTYAGPLLWKLQVRRGLVEVRGREFPATAVIGVEFTSTEIAEAG